MKSHKFDTASFIFGVLFVGLATAATFTNYDIGARWFAWAGAAILIAGGLAMVFGSRRHIGNGD